jgi:hypothetical protein
MLTRQHLVPISTTIAFASPYGRYRPGCRAKHTVAPRIINNNVDLAALGELAEMPVPAPAPMIGRPRATWSRSFLIDSSWDKGMATPNSDR